VNFQHPSSFRAFGAVDPASVTSSPKVAEAQSLLNAKGYATLKVDGILGEQTRAAIQNALGVTLMGGKGQDPVTDSILAALRSLPTKVKNPGPITVGSGPQETGLADPPWKKPLFIGLAVAAVVAVGFFVVKNESSTFSGTSEGDAERRRRRGRGRSLANGDATVHGDEVFGAYAKPIEAEVVSRKAASVGTLKSRVKCKRTPDFDSEGEAL
jgi:hypothetical protein